MTVDLKQKPVQINQSSSNLIISKVISNVQSDYQKYYRNIFNSCANSIYSAAMNKFLVSLLLFIFCVSTLCVPKVQCQENSYYYYSDANADIHVKDNEINQNNFQSLIHKEFFSVFSNDMPILNSVENQSLNEHNNKRIYATNIESEYSATYSNNQIPIAKFRPAILDFKQQPIGMPKLETVVIMNIGEDTLNLESISGSTIHFYCTFFMDKVIPPGGNTSFDVYFLARDTSTAESSIYINTNKGIIKYNVQGIGINNEYKLKPILNARIPVNTSFTSLINFHNPHNSTMEVLEIYTSDDDMHIEMPDHLENSLNSDKTRTSEQLKMLILNNASKKRNTTNMIKEEKYWKNSSYFSNNPTEQQIWNIKPFLTKQIAVLRYIGRQANNHTAFICISARINSNENKEYRHGPANSKDESGNKIISFILPVELEITQQQGIFSPTRLIDFGTIFLDNSMNNISSNLSSYFTIESSDKDLIYFSDKINNSVRVVDLYLTNSASKPLQITEIYSVRHNSALSILINDDIVLPSDIQQLTKVAEIKFYPKKSKRSSQNYGKIIIKTNDKSIWLQMNFVADLYNGNLEYNKEKVNFYVPNRYNESQNTNNVRRLKEKVVKIELQNKLSFPIVINSILLNEHARNYFEILNFNEPILLSGLNGSENHKSIFELKFDPNKFVERNSQNDERINSKNQSINIYSKFICTVLTNFTSFQIPLHIYDGQLSFRFLSEASINRDDLLLNPITINSTKEIPIMIDNINPIDINFDTFEINRVVNNKNYLNTVINKLAIKFAHFEPLFENSEHEKIFINKNFSNESILKIKIPAFHRMVVKLTVDTSHDGSIEKSIDLSNSPAYEYDLTVSTKYQTKKKFRIEFTVVNGFLKLTQYNRQHEKKNDKNKESVYQDTSVIRIDSFPTKISVYPVYIKNKFASQIQTNSIEFLNFGDSFTFNWLPNLKSGPGLIKANSTSLIGHIHFNPQFICIPFCYTGLEPRKRVSIIDRSSLYIERLQDINLNTEKSQIYDLWLKTFSLKTITSVKNSRHESVEAFQVDKFLHSLLKQHWLLVNKNKIAFSSSMKLLLRQKSKEKTETFSYRFPIEIDFKWPRLIKNTEANLLAPILFPMTQVSSGRHSRNITLHNPSNSSVLMQVMLASSYMHKQSLYELLQSESSLFYDFKYQSIVDNIFKSEYTDKDLKQSFFRIQINIDQKESFMSQEFEQLNTIPDRNNSFIFILESNTQINLQLEFYPEKIGNYQDLLIIRNNLTIIDAQLISGAVGSAELRVNNLPPMKSSLFFNEIQHSTMIFKTTDFSNMILQMNQGDFEHCTSDSMVQDTSFEFDSDHFMYSPLADRNSYVLDKIYHDNNQLPNIKIESNGGNDLVFMSQELTLTGTNDNNNNDYKSSYKTRDGIVLRGYLVLKNIGNTDLNVMNIVFDGDSCFSRGIEVTNCNPFTVSPFNPTASLNESLYLLEVRYRPDFTMALIRKSLLLETNIGDLRYSIEIQIPHYMLSICHDSLPRPPLEGYLFYLGIFLVILLVIVMLLTSVIESRSIIKYQYEIYRQLFTMSESKSFFESNGRSNQTYSNDYMDLNIKDCKQVNKQANQSNPNKLTKNQNNKAVSEKKSNPCNNQMNIKKVKQNSESPQQTHHNRNLTKSLSNSRSLGNSNNVSSDISTSSSSTSNNTNSKKSTVQSNSSPKAEKSTSLKDNNNNNNSSSGGGSNEEKLINTTLNDKTTVSASIIPKVNGNETGSSACKQAKAIITNNVKQLPKTKNNRPTTPASIETNVFNTIPPMKKTSLNANNAHKPSTPASIQNENLAIQRKNYLNQQKSQLKTSKSTPDETLIKSVHKSPIEHKNEIKRTPSTIQHQTLENLKTKNFDDYKLKNEGIKKNSMLPNPVQSESISKVALGKTNHQNLASPIFSSNLSFNKENTSTQLENLEIELLNTQLQKLQQQNKQQLEEINYLNSSAVLLGSKTGTSESSSSPSPSSSSSSSSSSTSHKNANELKHQSSMIQNQQIQHDLIDMIIDSNKMKNKKYDYDRIVQETEEFKHSLYETQQSTKSFTPPPLTEIHPSEKSRTKNLDKLLFSLINQSENQNRNQFSFLNSLSHTTLKNSLTEEDSMCLSNQHNGFLGPIQRPKNFPNQQNFNFDNDMSILNSDLNAFNQYSLGSNLNLTGEDLAILSVLFSAQNLDTTNKSETKSSNFNMNIPVKPPVQKAKSSEENRFHEFRLFENNLLNNSNKSDLLLENNYNNIQASSPSYWPLSSSMSTSTSLIDKKTDETNATPWNSVLLNDFDSFEVPTSAPSLNNSTSGNHIKDLWATNLKELSSEKSVTNEKQTKVLKNKKK